MRQIYYWLDLAVGFGGPLLLHLLYGAGRLSRRPVGQFWLGCAVGALWELPIFVGSNAVAGWATIVYITAPPLPWPVFMVCHTLWDGLLFVVGCWLIQRVFGQRAWRGPLAGPLVLFVAWGQVQAVAVELSAITNDAWQFLDLAWNPALVQVGGHNLTLMQQGFWLAGSVGYFFIWRRVEGHRAPP